MRKVVSYASLKALLQKEGYSEKMIRELWKWYGLSEKRVLFNAAKN